jgi:hypothetical protein
MDVLLNLVLFFAGILVTLIFYRLAKKDTVQIQRNSEQILEKVSSLDQALNYVDDVSKVDEVISAFINEENSTSEMIKKVVESSSGQPRDTWSKLLLIRIILRRLLRRMAEVHGISVSKKTAGIIRLKNTLAAKEVIDATLKEQVERIRDATFTAEWEAGDPPDPKNVQFTLDNYKDVFASLKKRMSST